MAAGLLCAESARVAIKSMEAEERASLGRAGRKKLEEYRQLKAALLQGDLHSALTHAQSSFSTIPAAYISTASRPASPDAPWQQPQPDQQQEEQPDRAYEGDPMVDVLLAQVSTLMAEKQKLVENEQRLQRENEQLIELVGYLSSTEQSEQQTQQQQQQQQQQPDMELGSPSGSNSSKEAYFES